MDIILALLCLNENGCSLSNALDMAVPTSIIYYKLFILKFPKSFFKNVTFCVIRQVIGVVCRKLLLFLRVFWGFARIVFRFHNHVHFYL